MNFRRVKLESHSDYAIEYVLSGHDEKTNGARVPLRQGDDLREQVAFIAR